MSKPLMDEKEIREARRARIPELIIGKMVYGRKLIDTEKRLVNQHGKVYVEAHKRDGVWVKSYLRDLNNNNSKSIRTIPGKKVDEKITNHYLVTALWSSTDYDTDEPFDTDYDVSDFDKDSIREAEKDLQKFIKESGNLLDKVDDKSQIGHDFWLTRNGHGAGFWDRPEIYGEKEAEKLSEIATKFPEKNLFAEGGKVYIE